MKTMNRRQMALSTLAAVTVGCRKDSTPTSGVPYVAEDPNAASALERRQKHLVALETYRVGAQTTRTTAPATVPLDTLAPALKALAKTSVRLHPRYGTEPDVSESKLGGRFLWPADEPWPRDANTGVVLAPILQLRLEDAPPAVRFREATDLLQILWLPQEAIRPVVAWRKRAVVGDAIAPEPNQKGWNMDYVPVPCRVLPELVQDYPAKAVLPETIRKAIAGAKVENALAIYGEQHATIQGTKVGGYPTWNEELQTPACAVCKWGMDFLATIASQDWQSPRWRPKQDDSDHVGNQRAAGLHIRGNASVHVFVCRRCVDWPVRFAVV